MDQKPKKKLQKTSRQKNFEGEGIYVTNLYKNQKKYIRVKVINVIERKMSISTDCRIGTAPGWRYVLVVEFISSPING